MANEIMFVLVMLGVITMAFMALESEKQVKKAKELSTILNEKNKFIADMSVTLEELKHKSEEREKSLTEAANIVAGVEEKSKVLTERINELTEMINNDREYIVQLEDENTKLSLKLKRLISAVKPVKKQPKKVAKAK